MTTVQGNKGLSTDLLNAMNGKKKAEESSADAAQNRFMTLLVTQMRNQDPLNPMDNAQVTSQFAQLSTVTGVDKLNATLEALKGSYQTSHSLQAASMIGHGVLVPGSSLHLMDGKSILGVELEAPADKVEITIRDASGKAVHTMDLGAKEAGMHPMTWDGMTDGGTTAANGDYRFEVTAVRGGQKTPVTALTFGEVSSVTTGAQGVKLNVPGLGAVDFASVRQIL